MKKYLKVVIAVGIILMLCSGILECYYIKDLLIKVRGLPPVMFGKMMVCLVALTLGMYMSLEIPNKIKR